MALLSFRNVLLLVIKLVIINEIVCFPLKFFENNIFSGSLDYVSKHFNSIQPRFNLQKLLTPETYTHQKYTQANAGRYNGVQKFPTAVNSTTSNSAEFQSNFVTESSNNYNDNNASQNRQIENKNVDEKWNSFFDEYFKKLVSTSESSLTTTDNINNKETVNMISPSDKNTENFYNEGTPQTLKDIVDDENIETINDSFTDTTDTTPFDNETTTGDDDLLRNGVPPELVASLLG